MKYPKRLVEEFIKTILELENRSIELQQRINTKDREIISLKEQLDNFEKNFL